MKSYHRLLLICLIANVGLFAGCQSWRSNGERDSLDVDAFVRDSLLNAQQTQEQPKKSTLAERNLRLLPAEKCGPIPPKALQLPKRSRFAPKTDQVNAKVIRLSNSNRTTDLKNHSQEKETPQSNTKTSRPPQIPNLAAITDRSTTDKQISRSNTQVRLTPAVPVNDPHTWESETAGEFEQPDSDLIDSKLLGSVNTFMPAQPVKQIPESISDFEPLPRPDLGTKDSNDKIQRVTYLQDQESSEADSTSAETRSSQAGDRDARISSKTNPSLEDDTGQTHPSEWVQQLHKQLKSQLDSESFEQLPAQQQELLKWGRQLMTLVLTSEHPNKDNDLEQTARVFAQLAPLLDSDLQQVAPDVLVGKIRQALTNANSTPRLSLANAAFCTEIKGFGNITPFPNREFTAGQSLLIYCEVDHFQCTEIESRLFETRLQGSFEIRDSQGKIVQSQSFPEIVDHSRSPRRDFFIFVPVRLESLAPGDYWCHVNLVDNSSRQEATTASGLQFQVTSPAKKQERFASRQKAR